MARVARDHLEGGEPGTMERMAAWLGVPMDVIGGLLGALEARGLVLRTATEPEAYVPGRSPDRVRLTEILDAVRTAEETPYLSAERLPADAAVDGILARLDHARSESLEGQTLRELGARL